MEKPIITLVGHDYKSKNTLVLVNPKKLQYKLVTPFSNALRCGLDKDDESKISWIDPSGGPMMKIGYKINDLELTSIFHSKKHQAFILEFKRNDISSK